MKKGNYIDSWFDDGVLKAEVRSNGPDSLRVGGRQLLDDVFDHFGPENIKQFDAVWVNRKNWDTNYWQFVENLKTMSPTEAAKSTWTGKETMKRGLTNVEVTSSTSGYGHTSEVTVRFTR